MKLYKQVMAKYYPKGRVTDALNLYGVATAEAFVELLYSAGKNPTRASLHEGVPELEPGEPVPAPGRQAEDRRHEPVPDQVRAAREVHRRDVPPVSATKCSTYGDLSRTLDRLATRRGRHRRPRPSREPHLRPSGSGRPEAAPSSPPSSSAGRPVREVGGLTFTARTIHSSPTSSTLTQPGRLLEVAEEHPLAR